MVILTLDISSSATGWSVARDGKLEGWGKYIGKQNISKGQKLFEFSEWIESRLKEINPDIILIEKPFRGRNGNVFAYLSKFVAIVECAVYRIQRKELEEEWFLDPRLVKKLLKVKKGKDHDHNKKLMVGRINSLFGLHLKFVKNKSKKENDDDIADALALFYAWSLIQKEKKRK